ncbi:hypothetical protein KSS87_008577 [Heliosperma pusillum]|nr:hypothetical protein KSS87_008577 [Heliosperma pusillum]
MGQSGLTRPSTLPSRPSRTGSRPPDLARHQARLRPTQNPPFAPHFRPRPVPTQGQFRPDCVEAFACFNQNNNVRYLRHHQHHRSPPSLRLNPPISPPFSGNHLHSSSFFEVNQIVSTPENQKHLLASLSQIVRQIRHWINNQDTEQQQSCTCPIFDSQSVEHDCLRYIVSILISLLNVDNKYIRHLVSNNFLVISEYLLAFEDNWNTYIRLLCVSFEFGLSNVIQPSFNGVENLNSVPTNLSLILNWNGVSVITRVLRSILKDLKGEEDAELVGVVLDSLSTSLSEVPWDVLDGVQNDAITDVRASSSDGNTEVKILLAGNLVQLLCSVVGLIGSAGAGSHDKNVILHKIRDIVPKIVLMIRLSFHMQLDCSIFLLWLQLLHEYFQDLLSKPLSVVQSSQDNSLEDSPFLSSLCDQEVCDLSSCHLQRQTVFLFVRCCHGLIDPRNSSDVTVGGKRTSSLFDNDSNFGRKKGLVELYGWLQGKAPLEICSGNQTHLAKCIKFTSSFITLYMHELQYDHQLLLDYLISKDTGTKCAEYLLRSLRTICDSWNLTLQTLAGGTHFCQSNCQKRCKKTFPEDSCAQQVGGQYEKEDQPGSKVFWNCIIRIQDAKACLLSLKSAMKKLHKKKLFPYNPEVLIKRSVVVILFASNWPAAMLQTGAFSRALLFAKPLTQPVMISADAFEENKIFG